MHAVGYFCFKMYLKSISLKKYIVLVGALCVFQNNYASNIPKIGEKIIRNHSYSNYKIVHPYKMDIELDVDMENQMMSGYVVYHLNWNNTRNTKNSNTNKSLNKGLLASMSDPENSVVLDTKGLIIRDVYGMDQSKVDWNYGDSNAIIGKSLVIHVPKHDTIITVYYRTLNKVEMKLVGNDFISALQWLNPKQTYGKYHPFMFSQSQAILARTWLPCMDVPAVKFTYNAVVNYPSALNVVMSAQKYSDISSFLKAYPNKNGEFRHFVKQLKPSNSSHPQNSAVFHQSLPISSYLMAIAVGDFKFQKLGKDCGVYAEPGLLEKAAWEFADLQKMIDSASALYGKYAWKEYNVLVLPSSFPFGGMENPVVTFATPTIITGDRSLVSLLAHELAHSWSGNLVTNETWDDFWLNEGFTVYFESRIMEKLYGKDYADMLTVLGLGELRNTLKDLMENAPADTRLKLDLKGRNPDDGLTDIAYEKGRFFLRWCEQQMGRKQWDKFLNLYFKKHAFSTTNTEDFIKELNQYASTRLKDPKFNHADFSNQVKDWIYGIGFKDPKVRSTYLLDAEGLAQHLSSLNQQNISFAQESGLSLNAETKSWTTHHYLHFLRNFDSLSFANMRYLDSVFHFSFTMNSEITFDWCMLSIRSAYLPAYGIIDQFLNRVGRRKFVLPIYQQLIRIGEKKAKAWMKLNHKDTFLYTDFPELKLAFDSYEKAYKGYHSVTCSSIEELFHFEEWKK